MKQTAARSPAYIWQLWSPHWKFDDATFERSAVSFDNPDFVAVTIQSYRHRFGYAPGDPALEAIEQRLAARPKIAVPTIALQGEADGVLPPEGSEQHAAFFSGPYQRRVLPKVGHNPPQEAPQAFAEAILELIRGKLDRVQLSLTARRMRQCARLALNLPLPSAP